MRNVKKLMGIVLVGLLTVIPLGFPSASSELSLRWDSDGRVILPDGYKRLTDEEFLSWYCSTYPDKCEMRFVKRSLPDDNYPGDGGGGC